MARSMFAQAYHEALQDLTAPDMAKIKLLRDLAKENKSEAANVVQVMAKHTQTCKESMRLPAIYLMDCVLKTVDAPYPDLLAGALPAVFSFVWDRAGADLRNKLARTAGTWKDFLPANVLSTITLKMQPVPQQQSLLQQPVRAPVIAAPQPYVVVQQPPAVQQPLMAYSSAGQLMVAALPQAAGWPAATYGNVLLPAGAAAAPTVLPAALATAAAARPEMSAFFNQLSQQIAAQQQQQQTLQPAQQQQLGASTSSGGGKTQDATQSMVDALEKASDVTRAKFLDLQFLRNRRLQGATHLVRPWFVKVEAWLVGTRAVEQEAGAFFDQEDQEGQGAARAQEPMLVEEDLSQPCCAISGEAFERTYDPDTDKWYYEDAVVLTGEQAAAYGVMEGSIVKASSLAGLPPPAAAALGQGPGAAAAATAAVGTAPKAASAAAGAERGGATRAAAGGGGEVGGGVLASGGAVDGHVSVTQVAQQQPQQAQQHQQQEQDQQHVPHKRAAGPDEALPAAAQHAGQAGDGSRTPPELKRPRVAS